MTAPNGILSGKAAWVYENSTLLPMLPGRCQAPFQALYGYCDIEKHPSSKAVKDEMALDDLAFDLGQSSLGLELLVFKSPEDARSGLRKTIGQHNTPRQWPGHELLATARGVLTGYKGAVDLISSTGASHIFAKIVAHGLRTAVVHSGDPLYDVGLRFSHFERSPWLFEDVLMLSAHMAFYWHREGNPDLEVRYLAAMAYRFFNDRFGSRYHGMSMLKNIDAVYDRMARKGNPVDGMVRVLHDTFLRIVGENYNASLDPKSRVPHWRRSGIVRFIRIESVWHMHSDPMSVEVIGVSACTPHISSTTGDGEIRVLIDFSLTHCRKISYLSSDPSPADHLLSSA